MTSHWMPLYVGDYLGDTGHLTTLEHGAYVLLIMHYWQAGRLPTDDATLARIARVSVRKWKILKPVISLFFDAEWKHKRIERELARATEVLEKRRLAGKARQAKAHTNSAHAEHMLTSRARARVPSTTTSTVKEIPSESLALGERARKREFETWYQAYPIKRSRGAAERAFAAARKHASLEELLEGARRYQATKRADRDFQYPATWLRAKGWLDEPEQDRPPPRATSPPSHDFGAADEQRSKEARDFYQRMSQGK